VGQSGTAVDPAVVKHMPALVAARRIRGRNAELLALIEAVREPYRRFCWR
jgi:hypothetical protein